MSAAYNHGEHCLDIALDCLMPEEPNGCGPCRNCAAWRRVTILRERERIATRLVLEIESWSDGVRALLPPTLHPLLALWAETHGAELAAVHSVAPSEDP